MQILMLFLNVRQQIFVCTVAYFSCDNWFVVSLVLNQPSTGVVYIAPGIRVHLWWWHKPIFPRDVLSFKQLQVIPKPWPRIKNGEVTWWENKEHQTTTERSFLICWFMWLPVELYWWDRLCRAGREEMGQWFVCFHCVVALSWEPHWSSWDIAMLLWIKDNSCCLYWHHYLCLKEITYFIHASRSLCWHLFRLTVVSHIL